MTSPPLQGPNVVRACNTRTTRAQRISKPSISFPWLTFRRNIKTMPSFKRLGCQGIRTRGVTHSGNSHPSPAPPYCWERNAPGPSTPRGTSYSNNKPSTRTSLIVAGKTKHPRPSTPYPARSSAVSSEARRSMRACASSPSRKGPLEELTRSPTRYCFNAPRRPKNSPIS